MWNNEDEDESDDPRDLAVANNNADVDSDNDDWGDSDSDDQEEFELDPALAAVAANQRIEDFQYILDRAINASTVVGTETRNPFPTPDCRNFKGIYPIRNRDVGAVGVRYRQTSTRPRPPHNSLGYESDSELSGSDVDEYYTANTNKPFNQSQNLKWMTEFWPDCAPAYADNEFKNVEILVGGNNMPGLRFHKVHDPAIPDMPPNDIKLPRPRLHPDTFNLKERADFIRDAAIEQEQELDLFETTHNRFGRYNFESRELVVNQLRPGVEPLTSKLYDGDIEITACSTPKYVLTYRLDCNEDICAICRSPLDTISGMGMCAVHIGQCGHVFHGFCIEQWAETRGTCPMDNGPWVIRGLSSFLCESRRDRIRVRGRDVVYVPELEPGPIEDVQPAPGAGQYALYEDAPAGNLCEAREVNIHYGYRACIRRSHDDTGPGFVTGGVTSMEPVVTRRRVD